VQGHPRGRLVSLENFNDTFRVTAFSFFFTFSCRSTLPSVVTTIATFPTTSFHDLFARFLVQDHGGGRFKHEVRHCCEAKAAVGGGVSAQRAKESKQELRRVFVVQQLPH
jgi:hypothetical protein